MLQCLLSCDSLGEIQVHQPQNQTLEDALFYLEPFCEWFVWSVRLMTFLPKHSQNRATYSASQTRPKLSLSWSSCLQRCVVLVVPIISLGIAAILVMLLRNILLEQKSYCVFLYRVYKAQLQTWEAREAQLSSVVGQCRRVAQQLLVAKALEA
jgi:hypothetical protein